EHRAPVATDSVTNLYIHCSILYWAWPSIDHKQIIPHPDKGRNYRSSADWPRGDPGPGSSGHQLLERLLRGLFAVHVDQGGPLVEQVALGRDVDDAALLDADVAVAEFAGDVEGE